MPQPVPPSMPVEEAAEAHAQHIVAGDMAAITRDCTPNMLQTPADVYAQLNAAGLERYVIVGHAKIGRQHVFKIRYVGTTVMTLHHRLGDASGAWLVLESERV